MPKTKNPKSEKTKNKNKNNRNMISVPMSVMTPHGPVQCNLELDKSKLKAPQASSIKSFASIPGLNETWLTAKYHKFQRLTTPPIVLEGQKKIRNARKLEGVDNIGEQHGKFGEGEVELNFLENLIAQKTDEIHNWKVKQAQQIFNDIINRVKANIHEHPKIYELDFYEKKIKKLENIFSAKLDLEKKLYLNLKLAKKQHKSDLEILRQVLEAFKEHLSSSTEGKRLQKALKKIIGSPKIPKISK